jgi:hypothetical protein
MSTTDYVAGLRGELQIATDSGFTSISQDIVFFIDGDSWARLDESIGLVDPPGTYFARVRILRDNENGLTIVTDQLGDTFSCDASAWSNTFTDTINVATTTWSSANADKSQFLTLSNGLLTAAMNNTVGSNCGVRGTQTPPSSSKRYFEVNVDGHGTGGVTLIVGIVDSTTALGPSVFPVPGGSGGCGGCCWSLKNGTTGVNVDRNGAHVAATPLSTALADNDKVGVLSDDAANTVSLYHKPGPGAWYLVQTITLTSQIPANRRPYVAGYSLGDQTTVNFGQSAFSRTLGTGELAWG